MSDPSDALIAEARRLCGEYAGGAADAEEVALAMHEHAAREVERERAKYAPLLAVATEIMREWNESLDSCPVCGDDGDHEVTEQCGRLDAALVAVAPDGTLEPPR